MPPITASSILSKLSRESCRVAGFVKSKSGMVVVTPAISSRAGVAGEEDFAVVEWSGGSDEGDEDNGIVLTVWR